MTLTAYSVALFVLAGLCEIGGGYLVWQWWRNGTHWGIGLLGTVTLVLSGIVPTYQPADFGRVYAASCTGLDRGGPFMVAQNRLQRLDALYLLAEVQGKPRSALIRGGYEQPAAAAAFAPGDTNDRPDRLSPVSRVFGVGNTNH